MNKTITIRGTGKASLKPDWTIISVSIRMEAKKYDDAAKKASAKVESFVDALVGAGFSADSIKTSNFSINAEYGNKHLENGSYESFLKGYSCTHNMNLEFAFDQEKLGNAINVISKSTSNPDIHISFTIKDKEAASNIILQDAVKNAFEKAEIIAKASNVKLKDIIAINYAIPDRDFCSPTQFDAVPRFKASNTPLAISIKPDEISVSDTVTISWEID